MRSEGEMSIAGFKILFKTTFVCILKLATPAFQEGESL